jgi:hypothetical protein
MGLLAPFRRFFHRMSESDERRYAEEIEAWASRCRAPSGRDAETRALGIAGVVRRITVPSLEGTVARGLLYDGTGRSPSYGWGVGRSPV